MNQSTWQRLARATVFLLTIVNNVHAQTLPSSISNLQLWLDASDPNGNAVLPGDGTVVNSWKDKSGNSKHTVLYNSGTGYTSPKYYGNQINGKGVIRFTRTSGIVGSAYSAPMDIRAMTTPEITMFTVYKQGAQTGDQAVWGCDNGGFDRFFFSSRAVDFDKGSVSIGPVAPNLVDVAGAGQLGQVKCLTAVYSKAGSTNGSAIYFNGQLVTPFTDYTTTGTDALADVRIGLDGDDNFYNGDIAEMIIYNRKLTSCEITQVNRYLNSKYGVVFSTVAITAGGATTFNEGSSVGLSSSTTGTAYQWLRNGAAISGAITSAYTATTSGSYQLAVTNGCVDTSASIAVTVNIPSPPLNALNFDGVNDYVDGGTTINATSIKTLECWARFNSFVGDQELISKSKVGYGIEMLLYGGNLSFYCMNGSNVSFMAYPLTNLSTNKWYHLTATWDGSDKTTMQLYVNGVPVGTRADGGNLTGVADPGAGTHLYVGAWNDVGRYFNGTLDEVRVWNTFRTQAQIRATAYDTLARGTSGLLAYYRFDHGTAAATNTGITSLKDYSSSSLTSTLINFGLTGSSSNYLESYAMAAPLAQPATNVTLTGFTANWTPTVRGAADNYVLDVSTDTNFTSFVSGYNGLNAGAGASYVVTGLTAGTKYYYRTRANKTSLTGQGANTYIVVPVTTNATLPVMWESFTATAYGATAVLEWATSMEESSGFFTIERSSDGQQYIALARVNAAGASQVTTTYHYTDAQPNKGINYYRIRETDKDGNRFYSAVRFLGLPTSGAAIQAYPSPANSYLFVSIDQPTLENTEATIFNLQGQSKMRFAVHQGVQKINLPLLATGVYMIRFANGQTTKFEKN